MKGADVLTLVHGRASARWTRDDMCYGHARRYYTREEQAEWLKAYADELENELKAVRERIQDLSQARAT